MRSLPFRLRPFRAVALAILFAGTGMLLNADTPWQGPPLATGKPKFFGSIYSSYRTSQNVNFTNYFNQVTPENEGKWGSVEGTRGQYNWTQLDNAYNLAKANGFVFRFHVLIWGMQQPNWIESLSPSEQLVAIREWFEAVAARYPEIDYLEVVNEPISDPPVAGRGGYIDALGGSGETGWDWIITAFEMAREIFPSSTKLMLNEYSVINEPAKLTTYLEIVSLLQERNLIDALGFQAHAFSTKLYGPNSQQTMEQNLDRMAATGLPLMATELDIDGDDLQTQLEDYQRIIPMIWEHPSVVGITLWGYRPGMWRNTAHIVNADGSERPAMVWLRDYVTNSFGGASAPSPTPTPVPTPTPSPTPTPEPTPTPTPTPSPTPVEPAGLSYARYLQEHGLSVGEHHFDAAIEGNSMPLGLKFLLGLDPEAETFPGYFDGTSAIHPRRDFILPISEKAGEGELLLEESTDLINWAEAGRYQASTGNATGLITVQSDNAGKRISFTISGDGQFFRIRAILGD